jgi:hypothetical protein
MRVTYVTRDDEFQGTVLNVRHYQHGQSQAYVMCDDHKYAGWVDVESLIPEDMSTQTAPGYKARVEATRSLFEGGQA